MDAILAAGKFQDFALGDISPAAECAPRLTK
jgi:hypothetical protein